MLGILIHACCLSTWKAEAGGFQLELTERICQNPDGLHFVFSSGHEELNKNTNPCLVPPCFPVLNC